MSLFGSFTRDQLRQTYSDAWRKRLEGSLLTPLEAMIADIIGLHPEYQRVVQELETTPAPQPDAAHGVENPFLHLGLHMAVREQLSIDRPPGVRELQRQLQAQYGDRHRAEHVLMEALAETLWEAQRAGRAPEEADYLTYARRRLSGARAD